VTPDASSAMPQAPLGPTETELNSEIVLTKSPDLLEAVVTICGLQKATTRSGCDPGSLSPGWQGILRRSSQPLCTRWKAP